MLHAKHAVRKRSGLEGNSHARMSVALRGREGGMRGAPLFCLARGLVDKHGDGKTSSQKGDRQVGCTE